jgi:predicted nucleotidyltransferase
MSSNEICLKLATHKERLIRKYNIKTIALFGSHARNEQTEDSDIDILVEFTKNIGIKFIDLADDLETIFGKKVDLVSKNGLKNKYYQQIYSDLKYV